MNYIPAPVDPAQIMAAQAFSQGMLNFSSAMQREREDRKGLRNWQQLLAGVAPLVSESPFGQPGGMIGPAPDPMQGVAPFMGLTDPRMQSAALGMLSQRMPDPYKQAQIESLNAQATLDLAQANATQNPVAKPMSPLDYANFAKTIKETELLGEPRPLNALELAQRDEVLAKIPTIGKPAPMTTLDQAREDQIRKETGLMSVLPETARHQAALDAGHSPGTPGYWNFVQAPRERPQTLFVNPHTGKQYWIEEGKDVPQGLVTASDLKSYDMLHNPETGQFRYQRPGMMIPEGWVPYRPPSSTVNVDARPMTEGMVQRQASREALMETANELMASWTPDYTGPIDGRILQLKAKWGGGTAEEAQFMGAVTSLLQSMYDRAGKQLTNEEIQKWGPFIPSVTDPDAAFVGKVKNLTGNVAIYLESESRLAASAGFNTGGSPGPQAATQGGKQTKAPTRVVGGVTYKYVGNGVWEEQ